MRPWLFCSLLCVIVFKHEDSSRLRILAFLCRLNVGPGWFFRCGVGVLDSLMSPALRHCSQIGNNPILYAVGTGGYLFGSKVPVLEVGQSPTCSTGVRNVWIPNTTLRLHANWVTEALDGGVFNLTLRPLLLRECDFHIYWIKGCVPSRAAWKLWVKKEYLVPAGNRRRIRGCPAGLSYSVTLFMHGDIFFYHFYLFLFCFCWI
jgi:hypothetical protein